MPSEAATGAFVEGGHGRRYDEVGILTEKVVGLADFGDGGAFGFVGNAELGEIGEGWHGLLATFFEEIVGKLREI